MTLAHPIARAWFSTGGDTGNTTGAQNYDEFADETEITSIIASNPVSALAIEMPHRVPDNIGRSFAQCLPSAAAQLSHLKEEGRYISYGRVVGVYRITDRGGAAYGLWCMADTAEISTCVDEPGRIIRNEDVFLDKVRERVELTEAIGHLLSPVLLIQTKDGADLHAALTAAVGEAGDPSVRDVDHSGRLHEVWALPDGPTSRRLLELAGGGEVVVADGNHRSLAAQTAGLGRFLAVITTQQSLRIDPYNRLVSELPAMSEHFVETLVTSGAVVAELDGRPEIPSKQGVVNLYVSDPRTREKMALSVTLPIGEAVDPVDALDHAQVERRLFHDALGLDPGDKRITYVGGDYSADWLCDEVDSGRAQLAVLIPPVAVDDFILVNLARRKMPRKSTWFTPKARAGLVVADLSEEATAAAP